MDKHRKACTESAWPTWPWPIGKRKRSLNKNMKSSHRVPVTQDSGPSSAISSQLASQRRHLVFLLHFDKHLRVLWKMFLVWKEAFSDSFGLLQGFQSSGTSRLAISTICTNHMLQFKTRFSTAIIVFCPGDARSAASTWYVCTVSPSSPWVKMFEHVGTQ